jgi:hypothetical protein
MKHALWLDPAPMGMGLLLWFCPLLLIAFLVLPFFGWQVAISTAFVLLLAFIAACWVICTYPRH